MKIAIYNHGIAFDGAAPFSRPLGGSESGVVYMARELARAGNSVVVYCNCPSPRIYDGVFYEHYHRFFDDYRYAGWDAFIAFRSFDPLLIGRIAARVIFWTGDDCFQPALNNFQHPAIQDNVDLVFCVSEWHRQSFIRHFGLSPYKVVATRNGFNADLVPPLVGTDRYSAFYTSTPFRGLELLLRHIFPEIRARVPHMKLEVFSSMKVYGVTKDADEAQHGQIYKLTKQPGVTWPGSLAQPELLSRLSGKGFLLYPNIFEETSCIAAIEAQASGAVVITSAKAGLNETVEHGVTGICLQGDPHGTSYQREFIEAVCGLLAQPERMMEFSKNARERAFRMYTWATIAAEWLAMFEEMKPKVVTGRYSGPLCLLEKTHSYLNTGNVVAARRVLTELDRTPFFKKEAEELRQNCGL